jgi:glycosyltransferase involved in cell wall biosynthesis
MRGKGLDLVTLQLLRALRDAGAAVAFLARGRSGLDGVEELGPQANGGKAFCWAPRPYYYGATQRYYSWRAAHWLASHPCDAVVAWTRTARGLFRQARRQGCLTLLQAGNLHCRCDVGGREGSGWPSISQAYRLDEYALADHIFVASQFAADSFVRHGVCADHLTVLHRGFAPDEFYPAPQPPPVFRVLFCGLIGERKGAHLLVEAWRQCGFSDAELWLVGDVSSEVRKVLRQQAKTDIVLHGFQHDVGCLMRQCRAVVLPSRNEGLAKALIESAACGLAIVATPESGFPMCPGVSGLQIARSVESIAAALQQLHDDPHLCRRLGQAARQLALSQFSWDVFRDQFAHLVAERLAQRDRVAA